MRQRGSLKIIHMVAVASVLVIFLLIFFMLIKNGAFEGEPSIEVKADNCYDETLRVITDKDYLPYSFFDEKGNLSGHDIEAITLIANEMHMNLTLDFETWEKATADVVAGKYDVLLTCDYFDVFDGADTLLKTAPISTDEFVVYSRKKVKSAEELYSKRIAVMENANVLPYIHMLGLDGKCVRYNSNKEAMIAVSNGEADCAVLRYTVGEAILKELQIKNVSAKLSLGQSYICMDVSNDNHELVNRLNIAVETLKNNGELKKLHDKWLTSFVHEYSFWEILSNNLWLIIVFAALVFILLMIYSHNEKCRADDDAANSKRIMALEDKFESLYDVELETGKYESLIKGNALGDINRRMVNNNSFFADTLKNMVVVYPADRERVATALNPDKMRIALEEAGHYDCYYRILTEQKPLWVRMRVLYKDSSRQNAIIGVFNAEEEMSAKTVAEQNRKEEIAKMTGGVSSYIVNPNTERFIILSQDEHLSNNYPEEEDYTTSISRYIENDIFEPDRKRARKGLSLSIMRKFLEKKGEYTFRFRDITSGNPRWYELRAVKLSDDEILYGFTDRDDEILSRMFFDKLDDDFFAIFCLNVETGMVETVKDVPGRIAEKGSIIPYDELMEKMISESREETVEYLETGRTVELLKSKLSDKDKSVFVFKSHLSNSNKWIMISELVISRNDEGEPENIVICFSYLDDEAGEKEELKFALSEARDAAEAANKSKTNFLFNMSHDIRTPMNAITGFTTMAKKYVGDSERVYEYLEKIETSGQQLLSLINQVLEMARIESGRIELAENKVNIHDEYDALTMVFAEQAKVNGLEFVHSLENIEHDDIIADQARVSSIILNIIGNAMKYTPKGGRINFCFREIPSRKPDFASYVLSVSDTGIGMSEEYLKVLFDPFTREKTSTVSKIQGTGLGMSIVKDLVDIMGGDIEVQSKPDCGTRFDITLDFKINHGGKDSDDNADNETTIVLQGFKALLVDDNELNREIALDMLSEEGLIVDMADDGTTAVEKMREMGSDYYDFILMDIQMPMMNGFEATREIKKMYPDLRAPIIALSANAFSEDREASLAAGMDEHVAKPIKVKELVSVLAKYL